MPQTRAQAADQVAHTVSEGLQGKVPNTDVALGHPIHPATVHWPIAFLTTTYTLSLLTTLPPKSYPSTLLPPQSTLPIMAHYTAALSVLSAVPSLITGFGEGYELVRKQYLEKGNWADVVDDAWNMKSLGGKKVKTTVTHASMNDLVIALAAYNWFLGWKYPNEPLPKVNIILGAIALPALFYSAYLGGKLVYEYAVGIQRQGSGKEVKEKEQ